MRRFQSKQCVQLAPPEGRGSPMFQYRTSPAARDPFNLGSRGVRKLGTITKFSFQEVVSLFRFATSHGKVTRIRKFKVVNPQKPSCARDAVAGIATSAVGPSSVGDGLACNIAKAPTLATSGTCWYCDDFGWVYRPSSRLDIKSCSCLNLTVSLVACSRSQSFGLWSTRSTRSSLKLGRV